ncbi:MULTISPECIES: hypothetical protein [unclassified Moraxella]|uniref:hypothetical protein n=1 Tax=unclassified Moraxella TaxID=2685852 RepID=UPI003AF46A4B
MLLSIFSKFAFYSYWGMALVATIVVTVIVAMVSKSVHRKFFGVVAGILVMCGFITPIALQINEDKKVVEAKQDRYSTAKAIFDERCKSAGEKIYKTVDNVEGVTLLKVRPDWNRQTYNAWDDPMWADAGLPRQKIADNYINSFLGWNVENRNLVYEPYNPSSFKVTKGYNFVDVKKDNEYIQHRLKPNANSEALSRTLTELVKKPSRYAIDYINYIDPKDREYWVAGTKVTITDTQTNEILAEKTWYALEPGQGSHAGQREPWLAGAISCPIDGRESIPTRSFVEKVLIPKQ